MCRLEETLISYHAVALSDSYIRETLLGVVTPRSRSRANSAASQISQLDLDDTTMVSTRSTATKETHLSIPSFETSYVSNTVSATSQEDRLNDTLSIFLRDCWQAEAGERAVQTEWDVFREVRCQFFNPCTRCTSY
jgi:hypothetical protein